MNASRCFPFNSLERPLLCLALILGVLLTLPGAVARDDADNPNRPDDLTPAELAEPEVEPDKRQNREIELPRFPRAQDLLPIRGDAPGANYNYYIDVNSVFLSDNEVLRYTIIIQSPNGSSNIVYEGIRCATQEIMVLAYGTRDGRFARMPNPKWIYVHTQGPLAYRTALVERYVCDENGWATSRDTVLERLVMHDPRRSRVAPKQAPSSD